ncbi:glycosyltransferase [Oxynema sp. CENA135]|uniref:glycosyltransferase n=1 Tax=Oxynema sp. CENA135 TaxID=984206 RepID=UPI00190AA0E4|nr:glycosyltransferase [Oxynema sp. CENA135]MBK4732785.1 glycosyltransferase [Oxynema sp. CENA135]
MALISVIIPAYNAENTIQETLKSVFKQTFTDFEVIVIDDGSQDATVELISNINDPRFRFFSYSNSGQGASRNRGLSHANGEYIAFLDADDLWTYDKLEAQLAALQAHPEAGVAYSWSDCIDENSEFLRRGGHLTVNGNVYTNLLLVNFLENGSNPLIRRSAIDEVGDFDESLPPAEDWDLYLRLAARYSFVAVDRPQVLYRVSDRSMSANVKKLEKVSLQVLDRAFNCAPSSLQYLKNFSLGNVYKYLTFKALEGKPERHQALIALRLFGLALKYDKNLLKTRVFWKVLYKIAILSTLSKHSINSIEKHFLNLQSLTPLLGYITTDIPNPQNSYLKI